MAQRPGEPTQGGDVTTYRMAPALAARFVGASLLVLALLVFVATGVVALAGLGARVLVVLVLAGVVVVALAGWFFRSRAYVVRCDGAGYRVRFVRGAGVAQASWKDVEQAVTASPRGIPCLVLRLTDGRSTTIPVQALAVDRERFVREVQAHLQRGHGLRSLQEPGGR